MDNPLEYLSKKQILLNIMRNLEIEMSRLNKNNSVRIDWDNSSNLTRVQKYLTQNSKVAGSTSAGQLCYFLGVSPGGKSFY